MVRRPGGKPAGQLGEAQGRGVRDGVKPTGARPI